MKTKHSNSWLKILIIILPIAIALGFLFLYLENVHMNSTERSYQISSDKLADGKYDLGDISLVIAPRGGDAGSWLKEPINDENGNQIHGSFVGTIYEIDVINNTTNIITDWNMTINIPEDMYFNNSWNGDLEFHQNVLNDEKVQTIRLNDFASYDISLDYYMDPTGPMVRAYKGDYFFYTPNVDLGEVPLSASKPSEDKFFSAKIGFIVYIPDKTVDYVADFGSGEFKYFMKSSIIENPIFWILIGLSVIWLMLLAAFISMEVKVKALLERQKRDGEIIEQTMNTFVNFIEAKDPSTMGHSLRVAQYSRLIAEQMNFSDQEIRKIYYIALMHDCGKLYIPDSILTKPAKLTDEEYTEMKKHTVYGKELLKHFSSIDGIDTGAFYHHERFDGKGYPTGIAGEDIPLTARIIGICDAFDAMNSTRCYRENLTREKILSELVTNKDKQFDGKIVDCLLKMIEEGKIKIN